MVEQLSDLNATFAALSDATRRAILRELRGGEVRLSDLARPFEMTQTAVSKHVSVLSTAGLVVVEKRGRTRHCRLNGPALRAASEWLDEYQGFWDQKLANLANHFEQEDARGSDA